MWKNNQRSQAQFDRAKWRPMILFPCWALQLGLTLTMVGLFSARLGDTMHTYKEEDKKGHLPVIEIVWESTNVGLSAVASVCTIVEIAKYSAESLTPWTMLFTHVIKLTCGIAVLTLDIIIYVQRHDRHYSLIGLALDCAFIVTSLALVIYAVLLYRRLSKYDIYAHPVNVKPFGFRDGMEPDNSYMSKIRPSLDKRLSVTSSRLSISSVSPSSSAAPTVHVEMENLDRDRVISPSVYTHKRDTQFDEYRARRSSVGGTSERSVSGEFAWSPSDIQGGDLSRSNSLSAGVVGSRPRGLSAPRAPSYASDRGLVAVPEEDDEPLDKKGLHAKDREALLDPNHRDSVDGPPMMQDVDMVDATQTRYHQ